MKSTSSVSQFGQVKPDFGVFSEFIDQAFDLAMRTEGFFASDASFETFQLDDNSFVQVRTVRRGVSESDPAFGFFGFFRFSTRGSVPTFTQFAVVEDVPFVNAFVRGFAAGNHS